MLYFNRDTGAGVGSLALTGMPMDVQLITNNIIAVGNAASLSLANFGGGPVDFAVGGIVTVIIILYYSI